MSNYKIDFELSAIARTRLEDLPGAYTEFVRVFESDTEQGRTLRDIDSRIKAKSASDIFDLIDGNKRKEERIELVDAFKATYRASPELEKPKQAREISDFNRRVLDIAQERLKGMPGAYQDFKCEYVGEGCHNIVLRSEFAMLAATSKAFLALGEPGRVNREICALVDKWADAYPHIRVAPLVGVQAKQIGKTLVAPSSAKPATWQIRKPKRAQGYNMALYDLLKAQHDSGLPRPTTEQVLSAWHESPPQGITVTKKLRGFTGIQYQAGGKQPERIADSEAITKAIHRMTELHITKSGKRKSPN